jgi:hypothetical protein
MIQLVRFYFVKACQSMRRKSFEFITVQKYELVVLSLKVGASLLAEDTAFNADG